MSPVLLIADYVVIGTVLACFAGIGLFFRLTGGKQKTTQEFLLADKNSGVLPVSFSLMATVMSAISTLGTPSEVYYYGLQIVVLELFFSVGIVISTYCLVPVFFNSHVDSIYEYLEKRFGKPLKIAVSLLYSVQMILYMPVVVYAPSLALSMVTGLSVWSSVVTMAVVCTFYSTLGGLKAVLWTDLFQGVLMLLSMIMLIIKGSLDFGGFSQMIETANEGGRLDALSISMDPTVRYTLWNVLAQGIVSGLYYYSSTYTIVQRLISCGSLKKAQSSLLWNIPLCALFRVSSSLLGVVIYSYFHDCDPLQDQDRKITSGDQLVPYFILKLFGHLPGLSGFCIAGIFSAALSTMSSIVNSLAAVTVEDYIRPYWKSSNLSESKVSLLAKALAFFYGLLCLILAFVIANAKSLLEVGIVVVGMVGGPTLGVFCLGIFSVTANEEGTLFGLLVGFIVSAWLGFGRLFHKYQYPPLPLSTEGCYSNISYLAADQNNNSTLYMMETTNYNATISSLSYSGERHTHLMYKISHMWLATISFVITLIAGYIGSLVVGRWRPKNKLNPQQISPFVRRWIGYHPEFNAEIEQVELSPSQNTSLIDNRNELQVLSKKI